MAIRRGIRLIGRAFLGLFFCWMVFAFLAFLSIPSFDYDSSNDFLLPDYLLVPVSFATLLPFMIPWVPTLTLIAAYLLLITAAAGMAFVSDK